MSTCADNNLLIATTWPRGLRGPLRPLNLRQKYSFHNIKQPLNNDHLSKMSISVGLRRVVVDKLEYTFDFQNWQIQSKSQ